MEHIQTKTILAISADAADVMIKDAESSFPDECCGFFFGEESESQRTISHAIPVINHKDGDKRRRFEINPIDYMKAERYAAEHDLSLLGVYHSHPLHPAIPSETDRLAAQPFFSYLIISVFPDNPVVLRSWRLNEQVQFEEELVHTFQNR
ncbi:MAG: hypothetical protein RL220_603 [Bacteroidota bacterium]|jgi:proteasome lid subunit RPN8/RPN11